MKLIFSLQLSKTVHNWFILAIVYELKIQVNILNQKKIDSNENQAHNRANEYFLFYHIYATFHWVCIWNNKRSIKLNSKYFIKAWSTKAMASIGKKFFFVFSSIIAIVPLSFGELKKSLQCPLIIPWNGKISQPPHNTFILDSFLANTA